MIQEKKNRRPIRSRTTAWANRATVWLKNKGVMPNTISLLSVFCAEIATVAFLLAFYYGNYWSSILCFIFAILGIQFRLICNLLDGMLADASGFKSSVGRIYSELPDRISDIVIFLGVGYGLWMFEWAIYLGWAVALLSVMTAYVRLLGAYCGLEHNFLGPMAKQQRMVVLIAGCAESIIIPFYGHWILYICLWIIAVGSFITIIRRIYYIISTLNRIDN